MLDDIIVAEESGRSVLSVKKILDLFLPFHWQQDKFRTNPTHIDKPKKNRKS
jgi:hypothetical protein